MRKKSRIYVFICLRYRQPSPSVVVFLGLQLKPSPSGSRKPERPLITHFHLFLIHTAQQKQEFVRQMCADYTAIYKTILQVSRCSIYCPALASQTIAIDQIFCVYERLYWYPLMGTNYPRSQKHTSCPYKYICYKPFM